MADSETQQVTSQTPADTTQQVTSQTPATKQKNPKRVAAGKAVAERTRISREEQKKALIKGQSIIANNQTKVDPPPVSDAPSADPPTDTTSAESAKNVLTTTQWLSVISIVVSLAGIYYKREEIKGLLTKKPPLAPPGTHLSILRQEEASNQWIELSFCFDTWT